MYDAEDECDHVGKEGRLEGYIAGMGWDSPIILIYDVSDQTTKQQSGDEQ